LLLFPQVGAHLLRAALDGAQTIMTTEIILQELLQGYSGPHARRDLIHRFSALPLLGQLCIRHDLTLLTTDGEFVLATRHCPLRV
jgi:predicted nucleic acid-binding protein